MSKNIQWGGRTTNRQRHRIPREDLGGCDPDFLHTLPGKGGNGGEIGGISHIERGNDPRSNQDHPTNGFTSSIQVNASKTREEGRICDSVDQLEGGDEQHKGKFETDFGDVPTRIPIDRVQ